MPAQPPRDRSDLRTAFAREGRLYLLGLVCAVPGALTVWATGSFWVGAAVFLAVLGVAGSALWVWERRRAERDAGGGPDGDGRGTDGRRRPDGRGRGSDGRDPGGRGRGGRGPRGGGRR